ncbi:phosphatase PAP2 family protein [Flavobacterium rakeshii]|uniref:Phosphatase PAP2 family protein n=1 Tax=Flavobacterium rakeshii TaxID=1038845 RepID=A0A6N8HHG9_9FLAO|nr:phosphatase PAP2 family protein [Flavobacterium rakeshii]MUV05140.1 phosphatase PAP2 family protein [Flavobacterium rakeshii]
MLDSLIELDKNLLIYLNSLGTPAFDGFWLFITKQLNWIPVFLFLLYLTFKNLGWRNTVLVIIMLSLLITLTDQTTNLFKNTVQRLRPLNNPDIAGFVRGFKYSSSYSFFSGHASNSMACAFFLYHVLKPHVKHMWIIFLWPLIFAYSRIYLALHYPGDILSGFVWGIFTSSLLLMLYRFLRKFLPKNQQGLDNPANS